MEDVRNPTHCQVVVAGWTPQDQAAKGWTSLRRMNPFRHEDRYHTSLDGHSHTRDMPLEGPAGSGYSSDDEHRSPMPLSWHSPYKRILSSPFTDDSNSDDGLSASTFLSPETNSDLGEVEEDEGNHTWPVPRARVSSLLVRKTPTRWYEWLDPSIKRIKWSKVHTSSYLPLFTGSPLCVYRLKMRSSYI